MADIIKEQNAYYRRKLNTYSYIVNSRNSGGTAFGYAPHQFAIDIPPFPFPTHQQSNLAIFRLIDCYVCNQGDSDNERVSNSINKDISGFILSVQGLGTRSMLYNNTNLITETASALLPKSEFLVMNRYGTIVKNAGAKDEHQVCSGDTQINTEVVVSNPSGTHLIFDLKNLDTYQNIHIQTTPTTDEYYAVIKFEIELLNNQVSSGNF